MKSSTILRTAALMISLAGLTAGASAQTLTAVDSQPALTAMTSVREGDHMMIETKATRADRMAESVAAVQGFEAEATVRQAIEGRISEDAPEAKVLRAVMKGKEWSVKMTELGLPKSEYRRGVVVYQLPGQDVVIHRMVVVERPYFAHKDDAIDYDVRLGTPRVR